MTAAVYREHDGAPWQDVELIGHHANGKLILRETGRVYCGVFLAELDQVRICGRTFDMREPHRFQRKAA